MRAVRLTPEAEHKLGCQLDYLLAQGANRAATHLAARIERFISSTLAAFPRTGRFIPERELWESWIPGTRIVAWYVTDEELVVITFWHSAQDRLGPRS